MDGRLVPGLALLALIAVTPSRGTPAPVIAVAGLTREAVPVVFVEASPPAAEGNAAVGFGESVPELRFQAAAESTAPEPNPGPDPVMLPIEVLSATWTQREVTVSVPFSSALDSPDGVVFEARIFGLDYDGKATLEINDSFSLSLENGTVRLPARQAAFGGIGGMYSTLRVQVPLPPGTVRPGRNRIRFVFNGTDGDSIGYRVLRFNLLAGGEPLLPAGQFVDEDPATWAPPLGDAASIEAGRALWETKELVTSSLATATPIRARCADCHARDGYDLKYFNFSNLSIIERSRFHGMTEEEGRQVASYIRSLAAPSPGRPWNPPYQPGPGMDARPVAHWAAGAGIDAVLEDDRDTFGYLFAGGIPEEWDLERVLNVREIPVALELPVWNLWLPKVHPLDYYGDRFAGGKIEAAFLKADRDPRFGMGVAQAARAWTDFVSRMGGAFADAFTATPGLLNEAAATEPAAVRRQNLGRYGIHQWRLVKAWELMRRHELEGLGRNLSALGLYPAPPSSAAEVPERTWLADGFAFRTAPHTSHLAGTGHGIRDGTRTTWTYLSFAWYYLQLILDDNHRHGDGATHWPYMNAFSGTRVRGEGFAAMRAVVLFKAMEAHYNLYRPADGYSRAWSFATVRLDLFSPISPAALGTWDRTPPEIWRPMVESYLRAYLRRTRLYSVEEYQTRYWSSFQGAGVASLGVHPDSIYWLPQWYWSFKDFKERGIDPRIIDDAVDFARQLWPDYAGAWEQLRSSR